MYFPGDVVRGGILSMGDVVRGYCPWGDNVRGDVVWGILPMGGGGAMSRGCCPWGNAGRGMLSGG